MFEEPSKQLESYLREISGSSLIKVYYESGFYVITGSLEDLQRIKKSLNGVVVMSKISTGQSRHNCGLKYLRIEISDPAINKIIIAWNSMWGKGDGPKVFVATHEEILGLKSVRDRNIQSVLNPEVEPIVIPITKERAYANGTRTIHITGAYKTDWTIYPFKGTIMTDGYIRKRGLQFENLDDWETALSWILNHAESYPEIVMQETRYSNKK